MWNSPALLQAQQQAALQQQASAGLPTLHQFSDTPVENANPDFSYGDPNKPGMQPGWSQALNDLMMQMGGSDQMNSGYGHLSTLFQQPGFSNSFFSMYPGSQGNVQSLLNFGYGQSHGLNNGYGSLADIAPMILAIGGGALAGAAGGTVGDAIPTSEAGVGGAGSAAPALDTSGFGSSFDAANMGGKQYDMTGWGSSFDAGNMGGKAYDMTGWGSPFDASGMIGPSTPVGPALSQAAAPASGSKKMSPTDLAKLGLNALPSGGGMLGGAPALNMAPATIFTPVMPGALHPFGG